MPLTLKQLADRIEAEPVGNVDLVIHSAHTLEEAGPGQVSFLANPKYLKQLETTRASAVIVAPQITSERLALLKAKDPYYAFSKAVVALHGFRKHPHEGIHPHTHIDPTATVGEGCVFYPGVFVGPRARVGRDCVFFPNVVIYDDVVIGDRVTIHANACIGQDGFGYATHKGVHHKIPQVGNVIVEDDCEIGACCTIERAAMGSTVVGRGTKMGDAVTIGHGAKVGPHGLLVSQVGIAGSVTIGHHVTLAGQVGVAGHLTIGDNVVAAAQSGIIGSIPDQTAVMGFPAMPISQARRVFATLRNLPELQDRIRKLEGQVEELGSDETGSA